MSRRTAPDRERDGVGELRTLQREGEHGLVEGRRQHGVHNTVLGTYLSA